jgi:hypothetical protein
MPRNTWTGLYNEDPRGLSADGLTLATFTTSAPIFPTFAFPANYFKTGRLIHLRARGIWAATGTPTYTWRLQNTVGTAVTLVTSAAVTVSAITNQSWEIDIQVQCRTEGTSGTPAGVRCLDPFAFPPGDGYRTGGGDGGYDDRADVGPGDCLLSVVGVEHGQGDHPRSEVGELMADILAESGAGARGFRLYWTLHFDDAANTVTVNATHTRMSDGSAAPAPQQAEITFRLNTQQSITLNLLTGILTVGGAFDGTPGNMLNTGARTRTNVRLSVTPDRAQVITHSTQYLPPAA